MKYIKRVMAWLLAVTILVTSVDYVQAAEVMQEGSDSTLTEVSQGDSFAVSVSDNQVSEGDVSGGDFISGSEPVKYGVSSSNDVLYSGIQAGITWSITSDGLLTVEGEYNAGYWGSRPQWYNYRSEIKKAVVTAKKVKDTSIWFYDCTNLTEIDVSGFDVSAVTNMGSMFKNCSSLTSLDLSGFDTGNVASMSYMFENCSSLTSLDLSGLDTGNVTNMASVFNGCSSLTNLDVSGLDTGNVTDMSNMFKGCRSLTNLDVSGFDTGNVTTMWGMFWNCKGLTSLNLRDWNTSKVIEMNYMFSCCEGLASLDVSGWDTSSVTSMNSMFSQCSVLAGLDLSGWDTGNVTTMSNMFYDCSGLVKLDLSGFKIDNVTNMSYMLSDCASLMKLKCIPAVQLDCDLPHVMKDGAGVEYSVLPKGLTEGIWLYAQNYIGGEISGIEWQLMDNGNLIISGEYDGTPITGTELPWHTYAEDIKSVNIIARNIESTAYWFDGCAELRSVVLSDFDTSKVTNMEAMFRNCAVLSSLDVRTLDMSKVTNAREMFSGCKVLNSIHVFKNLKISIALPHHMIVGSNGKYTEYSEFPLNIQNDLCLTRGEYRGELDGLRWYIIGRDGVLYIAGENTAAQLPDASTTYEWNENFYIGRYNKVIIDAKGVLSTARWFKDCTEIKMLDLSGFDTASLVETTDMLTGCTALETVKTALNLNVSIALPITMYDEMATVYTECPLNLMESLEIFNQEQAGTIQGIGWLLLEDGTLIIGGTDTSETVADITTWPWHEYRDNIKKVKVYAKNVMNTSYWFAGCNNLTEADLSGFDMQRVTASAQMFEGCTNLKKLQTPLYVNVDTELAVGMLDEDENVYLNLPKGQSESITLNATMTYYGMSWVVLGDGTLLITGNYSSPAATDTSWLDNPAKVKSVKVTATGVKSTANWFCGLSRLETVDFSGFDTSLVTDMSGMFRDCSSLKTLDLSNFNTGNVTDMRGMFTNCYTLASVDVCNFDTSKVTDMGYMFNNCRALEILDLSKFDVSKLTKADRFLEGCSGIKKIHSPKNLGLEVQLPCGMLDANENVYVMLPKGLTSSVVLSAEQVVAVGTYCGMVWGVLKNGSLLISGAYGSAEDTDTTWHGYAEQIQSVKVTATGVTSTKDWLKGLSNLQTLDLSCFDTSLVTDMSGMFSGCSKITKLDLSNWNVSNLTSAEGMFEGCTGLVEIKVFRNLAASVKLPQAMYDLQAIEYIQFPFDVQGEKTIYLFPYCGNHKGITWIIHEETLILNGDGSEAVGVKDWQWLKYADQIQKAEVYTQNGKSTASWFDGCKNLEQIDWAGFDFSKVTDMSDMFRGCTALKALDANVFATAKATNLSGMFRDCSSLTALYISGWDWSKVVECQGMLTGCVGMKEIQLPANLSVDIEVPKTMYNYLGEPQTTLFPKYQPEAEWYYAVSPVGDGELHVSKVYPQTYTGKAIKPQIRVYDGATLLVERKDYTISYKNNKKAAAHDAVNAKGKSMAPTIIVKGKGNYTKTETVTFDILAKNISDEEVIAQELVAVAGKKVQKPVPMLTYNGKKLAKGKDFTVSYPDLEDKSKLEAYKAAGTYRVVVTGTGNFTGTRELVFTITDDTLMSKVKVSKIAAQEYTGKAVEPAFKVTCKKAELVVGRDYTVTYKNNVEVGKASVILTGMGDYAGTKTVNFQITGQSIEKASVSGLSDKMYNGQAQTQQLKVELAGKTLNVGTDYTVSYDKNVNVGTATITVTGKGAYTGTVKKKFKITRYDLESNSMQLFSGVPKDLVVAYENGGSMPLVNLRFDGKLMNAKKDYVISYSNHKSVASAKDAKAPTITIKGKGNFTGTVTVPFTIVAKSLQDTENPIAIHVVDVAYAAKAGKWLSKPVLTDSNGKKLTAGTDYEKEVIYTLEDGTILDKKSVVEVGQIVKVKVTGKGYYTGTIETTYKITPAAFKSAKINVKPQVYTGKSVILDKEDITVILDGKTLTYGVDYEIVEGSYNNNVKKGTASVTIKGLGNYGGEKNAKFKIVPKELVWFWRLFS